MNGHLVVKRYARALYEASRDASDLDTLQQDMEALDKLMETTPAIRKFCLSGNPSSEKGRIFIEAAFLPYLGEFSGRTVRLLEQNKRLAALPYLSAALKEEWDRDLGVTSVRVESAAPPDEGMTQDVHRALENRIQGRIVTTWEIQPDLLGGMTFQWNNRLLDISLKNRLGRLKRVLNRKSL